MIVMEQLNVKPKSKDVFLIQSHTNTNTWYEVDLIKRTCTCPHYKIRMAKVNGTCKHYDDLLQYLNKDVEDKETIFNKIEEEIRSKKIVEWTSKYDDSIINQMIHLGRLYCPKNGFLAVL